MNNIIVNESSANIRLLARQYLNGFWVKATLAMVLFVVCVAAPVIILEVTFGSLSADAMEIMMETGESAATSFASDTYSILVSGAFTFGISLFFIKLIRHRSTDVGDLFAGFGYFFKTLGVYFMMSLLTLLWMLLFIVPGFIAAYRYSMAFYILADDPSKGVMQCIRESKEMMKGNKGKLFCLQLSFIGWGLIIVFIYMMMIGLFVWVQDILILIIIIAVVFVVATILAACVLSTYLMAAQTVFYEMASGRLREA